MWAQNQLLLATRCNVGNCRQAKHALTSVNIQKYESLGDRWSASFESVRLRSGSRTNISKHKRKNYYSWYEYSQRSFLICTTLNQKNFYRNSLYWKHFYKTLTFLQTIVIYLIILAIFNALNTYFLYYFCIIK